jgi:hypothetical protein
MMGRLPILWNLELRAQLGGRALAQSNISALPEECLSLASLTKDPEKAAQLLKTADDYLHRAAEQLSRQSGFSNPLRVALFRVRAGLGRHNRLNTLATCTACH